MTKPKWYHYLLAAGSQDPDNPTARMHSPSEEARAYAEGDDKKIGQMHNDQLAYEKAVAPAKAVTAAAALAVPYVPHILKVLANPMAAKTTAGMLTASGLDAAGTIYGLNRNSDLINKWASGKFDKTNPWDYTEPVEFGLNLIPGWTLSKLFGKITNKALSAASIANKHNIAPQTGSSPKTIIDNNITNNNSKELLTKPHLIIRDNSPYEILKARMGNPDYNVARSKVGFSAEGLTPINLHEHKQEVIDMFNSSWYKNQLKSNYPSLSENQINEIIQYFTDNILLTETFVKPGTLPIAGSTNYFRNPKTGKEAYRNIELLDNLPPEWFKEVANHEIIHSSTLTEEGILPPPLNNSNIIAHKSVPNEWQKFYDYITSPDELRVRLLRIGYKAHALGIPVSQLLDNMIKTREVPVDIVDLLRFYSIDEISDAVKKVTAFATPIGLGLWMNTNTQNPYKNVKTF